MAVISGELFIIVFTMVMGMIVWKFLFDGLFVLLFNCWLLDLFCDAVSLAIFAWKGFLEFWNSIVKSKEKIQKSMQLYKILINYLSVNFEWIERHSNVKLVIHCPSWIIYANKHSASYSIKKAFYFEKVTLDKY